LLFELGENEVLSTPLMVAAREVAARDDPTNGRGKWSFVSILFRRVTGFILSDRLTAIFQRNEALLLRFDARISAGYAD
jgi:hypothetical protein